MPSNKPVIAVRTTHKIIEKMKIIAEAHRRSVAGETEMLIINHITNYEAEHGEIKIEDEA